MIGGQVIDIEGAADYEELVTLCRMKTAALITAAAEMGVLASGNQNEAVRGAVTEYAEKLGVAFQIKDDLLDVEGDASLMGKRVGGDAAAGKKTFVTFLGRDGARDALAEYTRGAKDALRRFGDRAEFLLSTADYLLDRNQ
jgi:geranylgeranyl pyrophosphate synthase